MKDTGPIRRWRGAAERARARWNMRLAVLAGNTRVYLGQDAQQAGWLNCDLAVFNPARGRHWLEVFPPNSVDAFQAEDVWHLMSHRQGRKALQQARGALRAGGYLRMSVPDGLHPDAGYVRAFQPGPLSEIGFLFTYRTLRWMLEEAGFKVDLLEYFDERGDFHAVNWNPDLGKVKRSIRFAPENSDGRPHQTSIIADAWK